MFLRHEGTQAMVALAFEVFDPGHDTESWIHIGMWQQRSNGATEQQGNTG
jgi:hypothetical protein